MSGYACPDCHEQVARPRLGRDGRCTRCKNALFQTALANGARWARRLHRARQPRSTDE